MTTNLKQYKGMWVRPTDASDKPMVNECLKNYTRFNLNRDSVVLDLGGHIGTFAKMCRDAGVLQYDVYEPDEDNFAVLTNNVWSDDGIYRAHKGAVSVKKDSEVTFYIRSSKQSSCSGTAAPSRVNSSMTPVTVKNFFIDDIISQHLPTHLKMDIEGAEKEIFEHWNFQVPGCVDEWAVEIHTKSYCERFFNEYAPRFETHMELVSATPVHGFIGKGSDWKMFGHEHNSVVYGFDLFYRRRGR